MDKVELTQMTFGSKTPTNIMEYVDKFGTDDGFREIKTSKPTPHEPGSPGKVDVLAERLQKGQPLWHAGDQVVDETKIAREDFVIAFEEVLFDE